MFEWFRVLPALWVSVKQLCTGFEVRGRVFGWFSGLTGTIGHGPTTLRRSVMLSLGVTYAVYPVEWNFSPRDTEGNDRWTWQ